MKKFITLVLITLIATTQCGWCASKSKYVTKQLEIERPDTFIIKGKLQYPKSKDKKVKYPTVLLLHSLGYSSSYWGDLTTKLLDNGFAVVTMDFRGHGQSIYYSNFKKTSWQRFKLKAFAKYPNDVMAMLDKAQATSKRADFSRFTIIGADIGANTAVIVARKYKKKPNGLVLISPSMSFKNLYIPVIMTEIGNMPILAIASKTDNYSMSEQKKLSRFAQGEFFIKNYPKGAMGMLMLKYNSSASTDIVNWIKQYIYHKK